ncbi:MAG: ACT domain-containing protein [Candidatus Competibacterales bacterium]|nr:ACT domain-containing protein [Candidatus Competibacterales bacterium]
MRKPPRSLSPTLREDDYVFCTFEGARYGDHPELEPIAAFLETEGLTLIIPKTRADEQGISYASVFKCITLGVTTSLDQVGLTAAFSARLAEHGISANVIAGYFHDHIFVPGEHAARAVAVLDELAEWFS